MNLDDGDREEIAASSTLAALAVEKQDASEQRFAAEQLAADARELEESLAREVRRAQHVADRAQAVRLQQAIEHMRKVERVTAEQAEASAAKHASIVSDRLAAAWDKNAWTLVRESALSEMAAAETRGDEARRKLAAAKLASVEAERGANMAATEADAAQDEATKAARQLNEVRSTRVKLEAQLGSILERFTFKAVKRQATAEKQAAIPARATMASPPRTEGGATLVGAGLALAGAFALVLFMLWSAVVPHFRPAAVAAKNVPAMVAALVAGKTVRAPAHAVPRRRVDHRLARRKARPRRVAASSHHSASGFTPAVALVAPPRIVMLSVIPRTVRAGDRATLCISADNAQRLFISGVGAFDPNLTTCRTVLPSRTTSFVAYAANRQGERTRRRVRLVVEPALFGQTGPRRHRRFDSGIRSIAGIGWESGDPRGH